MGDAASKKTEEAKDNASDVAGTAQASAVLDPLPSARAQPESASQHSLRNGALLPVSC